MAVEGEPSTISDGSVQNNGKLVAEVQDPSWAVHYQAGLTNAHSGTVAVTGGSLDQDAATGTAVTNDGVFTAGATLAPVLVGGFVPAANQEFEPSRFQAGPSRTPSPR